MHPDMLVCVYFQTIYPDYTVYYRIFTTQPHASRYYLGFLMCHIWLVYRKACVFSRGNNKYTYHHIRRQCLSCIFFNNLIILLTTCTSLPVKSLYNIYSDIYTVQLWLRLRDRSMTIVVLNHRYSLPMF